MVFSVDAAGQISFVSNLEDETKAETSSSFNTRKFFQNMDKLGSSEVASTTLNTTHQNQISCIRIQNGDKSNASTISTSAGDGKLVVWDLKTLEKQLKGLKL